MPSTRKTQKFSLLASQTIDENGPGSVLNDFEVLLGFLDQGMRTMGKHHLLPIAQLPELDARMTHPVRSPLKRPQMATFPQLCGLHLLSRATQLAVAEGQGKTTGRLSLNVDLHKQWLQLNPTERYFQLLDAWLVKGAWEMLGKDTRPNDVASSADQLWYRISADRDYFAQLLQRKDIFRRVEQSCTLALFELFGLVTIERDAPKTGQRASITDVHPTAFGSELMTCVFDVIGYNRRPRELGSLQPALQSYFPQWVNSLREPEHAFREGVFYFKVSLWKDVWRRIAIPSDFNFDALANCIIEAFEFDGDHLYNFELVCPDGRTIYVVHPAMDEGEMWTDELAIGDLPLAVGQSMVFLYDFGAEWRFDVKLERIEPHSPEKIDPEIVQSHGDAPPEYEFEDEYEYDDDDDDEEDDDE